MTLDHQEQLEKLRAEHWRELKEVREEGRKEVRTAAGRSGNGRSRRAVTLWLFSRRRSCSGGKRS